MTPPPPVHTNPKDRAAGQSDGAVPTGRGDGGTKLRLSEVNPDAILWDGFDDALVGVGYRCGMEYVAVYDRDKCLEVLVDQGLSLDDAEEYFSYNVEGAYVGEYTPIIVSLHG